MGSLEKIAWQVYIKRTHRHSRFCCVIRGLHGVLLVLGQSYKSKVRSVIAIVIGCVAIWLILLVYFNMWEQWPV